MSDETNSAVPRPIEIKTIIKTKSFGHPMKYLDESKGAIKWTAGKIIGFANGVSQRTIDDADEESGKKTLKSLSGVFKAIPDDVTQPIVQSSKLGLPMHIIGPIIDMFEDKESGLLSSQIAFEIGAEVAKNAVGYSWYARPLLNDAASDPLAALEAAVMGTKAIAPPQAEAEAGEPGTTKARRK